MYVVPAKCPAGAPAPAGKQTLKNISAEAGAFAEQSFIYLGQV